MRRNFAAIVAACLLGGARGFSIHAISHRAGALRPACTGAQHRILIGSRSLPALCLDSARREAAAGRVAAPGARMSGSNADDDSFEVTWEHGDGSADTVQAYKLDENPFEKEKGGVVSPFAKVLQGVKNFFGGAKMDRTKLAALGTSALLSYGFVSNVSYVTCLIAAWVVFGKQTGLSPLAAGQWPKFLAVYAGFWAFQNIIRPARFALSVAIAPVFDRFVDFVRTKASSITGREVNKAVAFAIVVFLVNLVGTCSYLAFGLATATRIAGVPLFPPKVA